MPFTFLVSRMRNKLFLAYSSALLFVFAVVGMLVYLMVYNIMSDVTEAELKRTTTIIRDMVRANVDISIRNYMRGVVEKNYDMINQLYHQVEHGELTEEEAKRRAFRSMKSQSLGESGSIYCINSNGIIVFNHRRSMMGVDASRMPYVRKQMELKDGYMEYRRKGPFDEKGRTIALSMEYFEPWDWIITASAYRDEFTQLVDIDVFRKRIEGLGSGIQGYPFILDYDGNMILHPHLEGRHYSEYGDPRLSYVAERIVNNKVGSFEYLWRNPGETKFKRKVVYYKDIPEMRWVVASSSYYEDFEHPLVSIRYVMLGGLGIALMLLLPISILIGNQVAKPIAEMHESFGQAANGDFSTRLEPHSRDEMGQLATHFNSFMEKLDLYSATLQNEIAVRKEAERQLIAHDKARTMFLSSASHELRTPLTSIIGFIKLMEKNFIKFFLPRLQDEKMQPRAEQFVENFKVVRSESDRLGRLVNDLLDLNKIEGGHMEWRDETLTVETILKRAAEATASYTQNNPLIKFRLGSMPEALVMVDPDRVHQVIINLLNNAFKYTDMGMVELFAEIINDEVVISVSDTGRGIPDADRKRVFDIFYQVQDLDMRSSNVAGTGLGLAISQQIVAHYGGVLDVESEEGKGSRFFFSLPIKG